MKEARSCYCFSNLLLYRFGGETDIGYNNGMCDYKRISHVSVFAANLDVRWGTYCVQHGGEFVKV